MELAEQVRFILTLLAALGCGLISGVFFAFSTFVMKALARLVPGEGIAAMQSINITVLNPWFLGVFLGTAVICALVLVFALLQWGAPGSILLLIASLLYLVGTLFVTIVCNVPRNNALDMLSPRGDESAGYWQQYLVTWTNWNHVRTVAPFVASLLFIIALTG